mmetsp:Transcript_83956/g.251657  ORF Transcript_83956/g.251657 Transcript_83956/m.251657 type:complete len:205 (-) Transcript_83956:74-688(-)
MEATSHLTVMGVTATPYDGYSRSSYPSPVPTSRYAGVSRPSGVRLTTFFASCVTMLSARAGSCSSEATATGAVLAASCAIVGPSDTARCTTSCSLVGSSSDCASGRMSSVSWRCTVARSSMSSVPLPSSGISDEIEPELTASCTCCAISGPRPSRSLSSTSRSDCVVPGERTRSSSSCQVSSSSHSAGKEARRSACARGSGPRW